MKLPSGWNHSINPKNKRIFFFNKELQKKTYTPPPGTILDNGEEIPSNLPAGWNVQIDPESSHPFYFDTTTKKTTWDIPTQPAISQDLSHHPSDLPPPPGDLPPANSPPAPSDDILPPPPPVSPQTAANDLPPPPPDDLPPPPSMDPSLPPPPSTLPPAATAGIALKTTIFTKPVVSRKANALTVKTDTSPHKQQTSGAPSPQYASPSRKTATPSNTTSGTGLPSNIKTEIHEFQVEGYLQNHFAEQKTGMFKKRIVPLSELMLFQSQSLSGPLLKSVSSKWEKEAIKNFDDILLWMGVRQAKGPPQIIASRVVGRGQKTPELRDEIFMQLLKQINTTIKGTPPENREMLTPEQREKAWQLLMLCCDSFTPSRDFEVVLFAYLDEAQQISADVVIDDGMEFDERLKVAAFAQFSHNKVTKMLQEGDKPMRQLLGTLGNTGMEASLKKMAEVADSKKVFGWSIDDMVAKQKDPQFIDGALSGGGPLDVSKFEIPFIQVYISQKIVLTDAVREEGVFRRSVDLMTLEEHIKRLNNGLYKFTSNETMLYSVLMKNIFKRTPSPLIPYSIYNKAIGLMIDDNGVDRRHENIDDEICQFVNTNLSRPSLLSLKYLCRLMRAVTAQHSFNRMDLDNLAIVFTPTLIKMQTDNPREAVINLPKETYFVTSLMRSLYPTPDEEALFVEYDSITAEFLERVG
ncbi:putative Rho GTPase-activating protein 39 [Blattamonas nauphoetae]|uniref:Rho GTPase-activating protein 39 n=1 Tax=Blattamonas nauphoetae TaxID=2049346 RepID=A0ABQ9WWK9_9EUKA|nr:putative Rho GTPase-activating protein 39 [Blattamonas nauphoetae]